MPFFFIVPVWLLFVFSGLVSLFLPRGRRAGWYVIIVSTTATLTSFLISTAVLYVGGRIGVGFDVKWLGVVLIGAYLVAIVLGAAIGGVAGFFLTRSLLARHSADAKS